MTQQSQIQLQKRMKMLDDAFHITLIALERLELYLESERNNAENVVTTALKTERDLHDDYQRPPTKESFYEEINLQCQTLFFQTSFDDKETFENVVRYFLKDLFSWYGGRKESITPNDIEKCFIPLAIVISREIEEVSELVKVINEHVCEIEGIENKSDSEKEEAIKSEFEGWLKGSHQFEVVMSSFLAKGEEVQLTSHNRGDVNDGVRRLYKSFELLYNDKTPSLLLYKLVETYLPEIKDEVTEYTAKSINEYFANKKNDRIKYNKGWNNLIKINIENNLYIQAYLACPVCYEKGKNTENTWWEHKNCGGKTFIGDDAKFLCQKCNHRSHVSKWEYECPVHSSAGSGELNSQSASRPTMAAMMSYAGQVVTTAGIPWLEKFMDNLG